MSCGDFCEECVMPGWNEYVADKHKLALEADNSWSFTGKPRNGPSLYWMHKLDLDLKVL